MIWEFASERQLPSQLYMCQRNEPAGNNYNEGWKLQIAEQPLCAGLELISLMD